MHRTTERFWKCFDQLPDAIQAVARENFEILKSSPHHPSLHFKKIGNFWSVRVGLQYRALGVESKGNLIWFWIGTHAEYDKLI